MKSTLSALALVASILPFISASPLNIQREAEPVLEIDIVTELAYVTAYATAYATEGAPAYTPPAVTSVAAVPETTTIVGETTTVAAGNGRGGKGRTRTYNWHQDTTTSTISSTSSTEAPAPPPTTTSTSTTEAPAPPPTTTSTTQAAAPTIVLPTIQLPTVAPVFTVPAQAPTTTAAAAPAAQTPSAYSGDDSYSSSNMQIAVINSTNTYRTMFQAAPVAWNQSLVDMAVASVAKCDFEHSNAGQNLAAGYGGPQGAVGGWGDEYKNFDFSHPDFGESTGHFTQVVWQDTTTVGCAAKHCPTDGSTGAQGWYFICNYFPVGNMLGEFPENVKSKIS